MCLSISIEEKKHFMKWFLKHFTTKKLETTWLLNYLIKQDELLNKISFVNDARLCPRAVIISSDCSDEMPFLFYKGQVVTDDIDKFFHDIRLHQDEEIYMQFNFKQAHQNPQYVGVLEENPFAPQVTNLSQHDQNVSEHLLGHILHDYQMKKLSDKIDQALDERDEITFRKLVAKLTNLTC